MAHDALPGFDGPDVLPTAHCLQGLRTHPPQPEPAPTPASQVTPSYSHWVRSPMGLGPVLCLSPVEGTKEQVFFCPGHG